jgi:predicted metal-dependent enzyme (double-stranded beta helix superfamily)
VTTALRTLVAAVDDALDDPSLVDDRARLERLTPAMSALLAAPDPLPLAAEEPLDGAAVGNLLHVDPGGRYHILAVVFPEGTSSGVHHHGCWGLIGYLRGGDEETRFRATELGSDGRVELAAVSRHVWHQGDITQLLTDTGHGGWHRVRNPGPGLGVSVHVLCRTPAEHPHEFWDRSSGLVVPFPFVERAPGRWRAELGAR